MFSHSVLSDSFRSHDACRASLSIGILQARILEWVAMSPSRGSSQPRIKPRSPTLLADSLPSEPPGDPKNTGVGSLFLLLWIFLTQGSNPGLLHCWQILYHLSHQGSPSFLTLLFKLLLTFVGFKILYFNKYILKTKDPF